MASTNSLEMVQKLYIGFYGRPADPAGLSYWAQMLDQAGGNVNSIINNFSNSEEYQDRFANLSTIDLVNNLYIQSFGRPAESAGLNYWVSEVLSEKISLGELAYTLLGGAQNQDLQTVNNKLNIANYFTNTLKTEGKSYSDDQIVLAKELLDSVSNINLPLNNEVQKIIANFPDEPTPVMVPKTITNYHGFDFEVIVGTSGDDTFVHAEGFKVYLGMDGNDVFSTASGATGSALFIGGAGNDTYYIDFNNGLTSVMDIGGGDDTIVSYALDKGSVNYIVGGINFTSFETDSFGNLTGSGISIGDLRYEDDRIENIYFPGHLDGSVTQEAAINYFMSLDNFISLSDFVGADIVAEFEMAAEYNSIAVYDLYNAYVDAGIGIL